MHAALKALAFGAACLLVAPFVFLCKLHGRLRPTFRYGDYGLLLAPIPTEVGRQLRAAFYRLTLRRCGRRPVIEFGSYFVYPDSEVGDYFDVGSYCVIGKCRIGDHVGIASRVSIISGLYQHGMETNAVPMSEQEGTRQCVVIGSNVWIGEAAVVAADVAENCIVGAGAVVVRPLEPNVVALGNPARVVRQRAIPEPPATAAPPSTLSQEDQVSASQPGSLK